MQYDFRGKYTESNPITRTLVNGFFRGVQELMAAADFDSALEVGCGEGFSTQRLLTMLPPTTRFEASDVESRLVDAARRTNPATTIRRESIYELAHEDDAFDLVFCLEVLEHLDAPEKALRELCRVSRKWLILTVPREPIWRALNLARLKYIRGLGNTPGHLQHWSRGQFLRFVAEHGEPSAWRAPLPWTQVLVRVS